MNKYKAQAAAAQKAFRQHRACDRKRRFESEAEAAAEPGVNLYHCPFCAGWHRATPAFNKVKRHPKRFKSG